MNKEENSSNKCLICGRPTHKESKYCIFHAKPEEKEEEEFKKALKEYINEVKAKEDKIYDFSNFIFIGDVNFSELFKTKEVHSLNFEDATFFGSVSFREFNFLGNSFNNIKFKSFVSFGNTKILSVCFSDVIFENGVYFENSDLEQVKFVNVDFFCETCFENTFFSNTHFENVNFFGETYFGKSQFDENISFLINKLDNEICFEKTKFTPDTNLWFKTNEGIISFNNAYLENIRLYLDLKPKVQLDLEGTKFRNIDIKKSDIEDHILQEKNKDFSQAKEIYLLLKNNFHSIGKYEDESWAFKKEKDMERKSYRHFKSLHKWLWSCFLNAIYGYGEKPERVIVSAMVIIIIFSFVFMHFGIDANPQLDTIPKYNILKELFMGIRYGDLLVRLKDISLEQIKNCLYFSTVTFTTLGYGDFRPLEGWSRIFAGTEAFIGAFMMALFVYTFARRTGGR